MKADFFLRFSSIYKVFKRNGCYLDVGFVVLTGIFWNSKKPDFQKLRIYLELEEHCTNFKSDLNSKSELAVSSKPPYQCHRADRDNAAAAAVSYNNIFFPHSAPRIRVSAAISQICLQTVLELQDEILLAPLHIELICIFLFRGLWTLGSLGFLQL